MTAARGVEESNKPHTFESLGIGWRPNGPIEQRVPCPRCDRGPRDDALGVNIETGTFHCFRCGWAGKAGVGATRAANPPTRLDDPERVKRVTERLRRTWEESIELRHTSAYPVRKYLETRGLATVLGKPPQFLRAHRGLPYFDNGREVAIFPAMVALLMNPQGDGVTVHATYLRGDGSGKAPVSSPKKILGVPTRGATKGGAIRLYAPTDGVLGVAEGIENALSLHILLRIPTWSTFCADNLATVRLPGRLRELQIGVDIDESGKGLQVAKALAARIAARDGAPRIRFAIPEGIGARDLNDELRHRGMH
jgi:putative DNA primase/helicase